MRARKGRLVCGLLTVTRLRNHLRCPHCEVAVGTWKPHGRRLDESSGEWRPRAWMCKWCGIYDGPEGVIQCVPDPIKRVWVFKTDCPDGLTPRERCTLDEHTLNPWRG